MTKILHKRSDAVTNGNPTLPTKDKLDYGELAINYADGSETIAIRNNNDEIIPFKSKEYIDNNDLFTKGTGANSVVRKNCGTSTATSSYAFAEGYNVTASGSHSHAEGYYTKASGSYSHAEGYGYNYTSTNSGTTYFTEAKGRFSHAEGCRTQAIGDFGSHSEGENTIASGNGSHAEGGQTIASDNYAHAEGSQTTASNDNAHAEGWKTTACGADSHAEGTLTTASGKSSHSEGYSTTASGNYSHAEGLFTTASGDYSHAEGMYNHQSTISIHCVGIGSNDTRKNAEDILRSNGYKYLINVGGYDGTNLTVTSGGTESINTNIKSVQEILNKLVEKAGGLETLFS